MKQIILILTLAFITATACEPGPVIVQDVESNSVITYHARIRSYLFKGQGIPDSSIVYDIEYTDPQFGDTLQKATLNKEWKHQMSFKGDKYNFEIYHYAYVKPDCPSLYWVPDSLYSLPDGCHPYITFKIYVNGIQEYSFSGCALGEFYNPNGHNWNYRIRYGYAYDKLWQN